MSQYLLLRDNKQSGPYSEQDIIAKGFKPYDLIWVEGKSAGWRYPGELPEFRRHAPMVEEQPFDRFYKKAEPEAGSSAPSPSSRSSRSHTEQRQAESDFSSSAPARQDESSHSRKVFVTLPGDTRQTSVERPSGRSVEETHRRYLPVTDEIPASPITSDSSGKHDDTTFKTSFLSHIPDESLPKKPAARSYSFNLNNRTWLMSAVGLCLVLAGVIIGLLISGSRQSVQNGQFDQLVKEMEARKNNAIPASGTNPLLPNEVQNNEAAIQIPSNEPDPDPSSGETARQKVQKPSHSDPPVIEKKQKDLPETGEATDKAAENPVAENTMPQRQPGTVREAVHRDDNTAGRENSGQSLMDRVSLEGNDYKVGLLGGISNLELTLSNNSAYPIDQVEVLVKYLGPEKKLVKQQTVFINNVAPGSQKTVSVPKSGRGVSASWNIVRINSKALAVASSF